MELSPSEVRIEHSVADQRAVANGFTVFYVLIAAGLLVGTLFRPEMLLAAVFFALFLVYWRWQLGRAQAGAVPWLVVLTPTELRHTAVDADVRIHRGDAGRVRLTHRPGPRAMTLHVLDVRDRDGRKLLQISLPGQDEWTAMRAAFEEWGWPVR